MRLLSVVSIAICLFSKVALGEDFLVTVGPSNTFTFDPIQVFPAVGDTVTFQFLSRVHSATTTTFIDPCPPPLGGGGGEGSFDTGFQTATTGVTPNVTILINDTLPHFVSCMQAAGAHCRQVPSDYDSFNLILVYQDGNVYGHQSDGRPDC
ncbi:hypothetical protein C8J56DRAFT_1128774 [Mycena floridula]|nr:hypothetical protein C8J56DRAFT_1128774 [Mycena floridula]